MSVEYTGAVLDVLSAPEISFDSESGEVTITGDANASSIVYTTDGSDPSAENGEAYEAPFTVEDGTIVKAIALGDGETYTNSEIASKEVLLKITSVAAPTFKVVYGTVAINCATAHVSIEYSTDGENFSAYSTPITFFEDATVYARASRGELVSEVASVGVTAVSKGDATKSIVMDFDAFDVKSIDDLSTSQISLGLVQIELMANRLSSFPTVLRTHSICQVAFQQQESHSTAISIQLLEIHLDGRKLVT